METKNMVFFWPFWWREIRSFLGSKSWWKDDIYWLRKSSCLELLGYEKYGLFFKQKVDGKMIFTWSLWAFHDIPRLGKYGFYAVVLLNSIWFFKLWMSSIKEDFQAAKLTSRDEIRQYCYLLFVLKPYTSLVSVVR